MDFLVSYTAEDRDWAEWIASHLGALGYAYGLEDPPSGPGADPLAVAEHAVGRGQHVIVIVSSAFVEALRASGAPQAHRLVGSGRPVAVQIEPLELPTDLRQVPVAPMHEAADDYSTSRDLLLTAVRAVLPQPSVSASTGSRRVPLPAPIALAEAYPVAAPPPAAPAGLRADEVAAEPGADVERRPELANGPSADRSVAGLTAATRSAGLLGSERDDRDARPTSRATPRGSRPTRWRTGTRSRPGRRRPPGRR